MLFESPRHRISAFTLVELLTVTVVLSLLSAIALGGIKGAKTRASTARAKAELAVLGNALEDYKRIYGDYPQLGPDGGLVEGQPDLARDLARGPGLATVQAKLFNCLTGVFGPRGFASSDRQNGPCLLDFSKFALEGTLSPTFQIVSLASANAPFKNEENIALLDPWGRRYLYYYKNAGSPDVWQAPSYLLYSVGPDGKQDEFVSPDGTVSEARRSTVNNSDNLYADAEP